jgi:SAM-dependent MidA family methyltransferase
MLQAEMLSRHQDRICWRSEAEMKGQAGMRDTIVLANELLDAFPVRRFRLRRGRFEENWVGLDETGHTFSEKWLPVPEGGLPDAIAEARHILHEGQIFEWNPDALRWIQSIGAAIERGQLIAIDYGDEAVELFAEHRMNGTLMCYSKHRAHANPYVRTGEQDITAHVNFTACLQAAALAGFGNLRLITQREFLVEQGLLHKLQALPPGTDPFSPEAKRNRAIRGLLLSEGMSELFKVMIAKK